MDQMVPVADTMEPAWSDHIPVAAYTSHFGDNPEPICFAAPSPMSDGIWGLSPLGVSGLLRVDLGLSVPFEEAVLTDISATTQTLEQINIGGHRISSTVVDDNPATTSGVFNNIPADAPTADTKTPSFDSEGSGEQILVHTDKGKKHKTTKNKLNRKYFFGCDRGMEDLEHTAATVLVGKVRGRKNSTARLIQWTREIWGGLLETLPEVLLLSRGWFSLSFALPDQTAWVLNQYWHIEMHPVPLKRWMPLFDPNKENAGAEPI